MALPVILRSAGEGAERLLDRILCVAGAVLFSQAPEFLQQYLQRLEGHLDEARLALARVDDAAAQAGTTLDQIQTAASGGADPSAQAVAAVLKATASRVDILASADAALRSASAWTRPFVFLRHADWGIVRATLAIYRPAVPTTLEGMAYAAAGMVAALAVYHLGVRRPIAHWAAARGKAAPSPQNRGG